MNCTSTFCFGSLSDVVQRRFSLQTNAATKLELLGYRVGYALVERIAKELPRISTELDCMKFICKEFWSAIFRKQVDNLRTNHQVCRRNFDLGVV